MPTVKSIKEEPQLSVEEDYSVGTDAECQTEDWDEDRMKKYRNMKRKLIELVAVSIECCIRHRSTCNEHFYAFYREKVNIGRLLISLIVAFSF
jgi:hypothetical protein